MKTITAIFQLKNGVEILFIVINIKNCSLTPHIFDNFDVTTL